MEELLTGSTASYNRLWSDIRFLARRAVEHPGDGIAWNHLLFAVGNFKRQTTLYAYLPKRSEGQPAKDELEDSVYALDVHGALPEISWGLYNDYIAHARGEAERLGVTLQSVDYVSST